MPAKKAPMTREWTESSSRLSLRTLIGRASRTRSPTILCSILGQGLTSLCPQRAVWMWTAYVLACLVSWQLWHPLNEHECQDPKSPLKMPWSPKCYGTEMTHQLLGWESTMKMVDWMHPVRIFFMPDKNTTGEMDYRSVNINQLKISMQ